MYEITQLQRDAMTHFSTIAGNYIHATSRMENTEEEIVLINMVKAIHNYCNLHRNQASVMYDELHASMLFHMVALEFTVEHYGELYEDMVDALFHITRNRKLTMKERQDWLLENRLERLVSLRSVLNHDQYQLTRLNTRLTEVDLAYDIQTNSYRTHVATPATEQPKDDPQPPQHSVGSPEPDTADFYTPKQGKN